MRAGTDEPHPGETYEHVETGEQIQVDEVGMSAELRIRYRARGLEIEDGVVPMTGADDALFGSLTAPPQVEVDPTRRFAAYLEVIPHDDETSPDTIAHLRPLDELLAVYERVEAE